MHPDKNENAFTIMPIEILNEFPVLMQEKFHVNFTNSYYPNSVLLEYSAKRCREYFVMGVCSIRVFQLSSVYESMG